MEKEEYLRKIKEINDNYEQQVRNLKTEYVLSNNSYKVDDIFEDHIGRIRIESINVERVFGGEYPSCTYFGTEVNKDGKDNKRGTKRKAWQSNEKQ